VMEIKYRAWDQDNQKMWYWEVGDIENEFWNAVRVHGHIPMQYTGITDENGKPIYDGDILKDDSWWWGNCAIKFIQGDVGPCTGDNVMEWRLYNHEGDSHNLWDGEEVEVIGNIHENPELLK